MRDVTASDNLLKQAATQLDEHAAVSSRKPKSIYCLALCAMVGNSIHRTAGYVTRTQSYQLKPRPLVNLCLS
jgi:hypothetical protein